MFFLVNTENRIELKNEPLKGEKDTPLMAAKRVFQAYKAMLMKLELTGWKLECVTDKGGIESWPVAQLRPQRRFKIDI